MESMSVIWSSLPTDFILREPSVYLISDINTYTGLA